MGYIFISILYVSIFLIMVVVSSKHIGYDVPRKMPGVLNHGISYELIKIRKTRFMWDE